MVTHFYFYINKFIKFLMNIICNNCVGARLYEVTKQQFPNPFMWMSIDYNDFIKLVENYNTLDLAHPKFVLEKYKENDYKSILVILNNDIQLHYIHYILDKSKKSPVKEKSTNILYKDILSYAKTKWFNRLNRSKEEPLFIYSFNYMPPDYHIYNMILEKLLNIKNKNLLILVHEGVKIEKEIPKNIKIEYCKKEIMELNGGALANALKNIIFKEDVEYNK